MKNIYKIAMLLVCLILALTSLLVLSSCGDDEEPTASSTPESKPDAEHTHSYGEWSVVKEATCTEKGSREKLCSCGDKVIEEIDAKGHTEEAVAGKAPTCTETGLTEGKKCSVCGEITLAQDEIPANGHSYGDWTETKAPTCTEKGEKSKECACGDVVTEEIVAKGHTEEAVAGKAPTCTETGLTEGKKCSVCGEITLAQETIPANGHSYGDWTETKAPTCTEKGERSKECACGDVVTEEIVAKGHTEEAVAGKAPTCTETGLTEGKKCSVCGEITLAQETIPATGHTDEVVTGKAPTCTETGLTEGKKCTVCGEITLAQETIPANGHTDEVVAGKAPTCTETGLTEGKKCTVCGEITLAQETIPANGHTDEAVAGKAPTCTETGLTEGKKCTVCGEITLAQETIPANGHTDEAVAGKAPTCTETGLTEGKKCSVCGVITLAQETIPANGHTDEILAKVDPTCTETGLTEGKKCSVCGEIILAQETIPANGHTDEILAKVDPTCTETGLTEGKKCSVCGVITLAQETIPANGHTEETLAKVDPTCTETGLTEGKKCSVCGEITLAQETIPANGHTKATTFSKDETCHWYECIVCDFDIEKEEHTPDYDVATEDHGVKCTECGYVIAEPLDHIHKVSNTISSVTPGCETEGRIEYYECSCGNFFFDNECVNKIENMDDVVIPANGHTDEILAKVDPTCTETGLTEGKKCTVCGVITLAQETIPANGHTDEVVAAKAPTCTETGLTEGKKCTVCGVITLAQETIPANGHTDEILAKVDPTCTETGLTEGKKCTVCGEITLAQETIPSNGHTEETLAKVEPTCTETGLTEGKKCSVCGEITLAQETIPATGHTDEVVVGKAPTCTETGLTDGKKCSVCGVITLAQETIPANGHTDEVVVGKAPTCTETGLTDGKKCSVCGVITLAQEIIPATGHTKAVEYSKNDTYHWYECTVCGADVEKGEHIPDYNEATTEHGVKCTECGYEIAEKLEPEEYTITYENTQGAVNSNPTKFTADDTVVLSTLTKDGLIFLGWYKEDTYTTKVTEIANGTTEDVVLYARWAKYIEDQTLAGTLKVADSNGTLTGSYKYAVVNGLMVIYKNGVETSDIMITAELDGTYTLKTAGLARPFKLEKTNGDSEVFAGEYKLEAPFAFMYTLTFSDGRIPDEVEIEIGENNVAIENLVGGTNIVFTATEKADYKISQLYSNGEVTFTYNGEEFDVLSDFELKLEANQTVVINVRVKDNESKTIKIWIEKLDKNHEGDYEMPDDEL